MGQLQSWCHPLANVLILRHAPQVKSITFHPKALAFIRDQSPALKREIGGFQKKTQKTPAHELALGQRRLQEMVDGND